MGSNESHFNVSLIVRDRVTRQCPQTTFPKRRESRSGIKPRSFCIPTVPLGQTGSQLNVDRIAPDLMLHRVGLWASFWGVITVKIVYLKRVKKITTKETPHYNIAKLNQPRFMAQVKAVVN